MKFENIEWNENDFLIYRQYLMTYKSTDEKIKWRKNIINTKMPLLGIYQKDILNITKEILNSNVENFLKNIKFYYYEETLIYGNILSSLKEFDVFEKYLLDFVLTFDNWSSVDNIKYKNSYKSSKEKLFKLSEKFLKSTYHFVRRAGLIILFYYIKNDKYQNKIFEVLNDLKNENDYYVNMAASWLLCEMFIKERDLTLNYYESNTTNMFIINKSISKCRDSYRVTVSDKEHLLKFKVI